MKRRAFLTQAGFASAGAVLAVPARAAAARDLKFLNTHTGERLSATYFADGAFEPEALRDIAKVLRDHRTNEIKLVDNQLLDLLHALQGRLGRREAYHVISGYRSEATNRQLHEQSGGVARHSLHMDAKAIDIRVPGVRLADLRAAALDLHRGGVGYYPTSDFVHVDTGRIRRW